MSEVSTRRVGVVSRGDGAYYGLVVKLCSVLLCLLYGLFTPSTI